MLMVSEAEVQEIVQDVATKLGLPIPRLSFTPGRISFMPIMVMNGSVVVTPAARASLSTDAIEFAVAHGMVSDTIGTKERGVRQIIIVGLAIAAGYAASVSFQGSARVLVSLLVTVVALVALLFAAASIRSKWPPTEIERRVLAVVPTLEGAREYARTTERFNLSRETPESWDGPHGQLFSLERLERFAGERKPRLS